MYPVDDFDPEAALRQLKRKRATIGGVDFYGTSLDPTPDPESVLEERQRWDPSVRPPPAEPAPEPVDDRYALQKFAHYSPLPEDIGERFTRDVRTPMLRTLEDKSARGETPSALDYLNLYGTEAFAPVGGTFFSQLRETATPAGLLSLAAKPAKGALGLAGNVISGVQRGAGAMYAGEALPQIFESGPEDETLGQDIGRRAMGVLNTAMGAYQAFSGRPAPKVAAPRRINGQLEAPPAQRQLTAGGEAPPADFVEGEILPQHQLPGGPQGRLPPGPPGPPALPGGPYPALTGAREAGPSTLPEQRLLTGDVPGIPQPPSSHFEPLNALRQLRGRIHPDFVREHGPGAAPTFDELAGLEPVAGGPPLAPEPPFGLQAPLPASAGALQPGLPVESLDELLEGGRPVMPPTEGPLFRQPPPPAIESPGGPLAGQGPDLSAQERPTTSGRRLDVQAGGDAGALGGEPGIDPATGRPAAYVPRTIDELFAQHAAEARAAGATAPDDELRALFDTAARPAHDLVQDITDLVRAGNYKTAGGLSNFETRELRRMLNEMESYGYEGRTLIPSRVAHTPDIWQAGHGGAKVFHDIGGGTRQAVIKALQRILAGKKPTAIGQRALDVARERIAGRAGGSAELPPSAGLTPEEYTAWRERGMPEHELRTQVPSIEEALDVTGWPKDKWWEPPAPAAVPDLPPAETLDELFEMAPHMPEGVAQQALDEVRAAGGKPELEAALTERLRTLREGPADTSFDPAALEAPPAPLPEPMPVPEAPPQTITDILDTGEAQPRLPGAAEARQVQAPAATMRAPQQATGTDFTLEQPTTPEAAARLKAQQEPGLSFAEPELPPAPPPPTTAQKLNEIALPETIDEVLAPPTPKPLDVVAPETIPENVRSFLQKQLKYTPDQINAMSVEDAIATGRARIKNPTADAPAPVAPPPPFEPTGLVGPDRPNTLLGKRLSAQERRQKLLATREPLKETPTREPKAPPPRTAAQKLAAGETITETERKNLGLGPAEVEAKARRGLREMGLSPRQVEKRAKEMARLIDDPTPENFERWVKEVAGQAERHGEKAMRAGDKEAPPLPKIDKATGEYLGSGLGGAQAMLDLAKKHPEVFRVLAQSAIGYLAGSLMDGEEGAVTKGGIFGALVGAGLTPSGARLVRQQFSRLAQSGGVKSKNLGLNNLRAARDPKKDINFLEVAFGTPERTVPDVFKQAQTTLDKLEQTFTAKPGRATAENIKLRKADVAADMREAADEAEKAGLKRKAFYVRKLADAFEKRPTVGQRGLKGLGELVGVKNPTGEFIEKHVGANVYRVLTGFAGDTALQNLSQPILTLAHVPPQYIKRGYQLASTATGKEATEFLTKQAMPTDMAEDVIGAVAGRKGPEKVSEAYKRGGVKSAAGAIIRDPQRLLRMSDVYNRRVSYLGAREYALSQGKSAQAAHDFAYGVVRKTQGHVGTLGGNPLHRGPISGSLRPFTKYPTMFTEHMIDVFNQPDVTGRNRLVMTLLGAMGVSAAGAAATGGQFPDLGELLMSGGRPLGLSASQPLKSVARIGAPFTAPASESPFPAVRAAYHLGEHLTGRSQDTLTEALTQDLPQLAVGRYPMKVAGEARHLWEQFMKGEPTAPHEVRTPSGAIEPHTSFEALLNLAGPKTHRQIDQRELMNEAYARNEQLTKEANQERADAKRRFLEAVDKNDWEEVLVQQKRLGARSARALFQGKDRTRFERLLKNSPKKIRKQLEAEFGERAEQVRIR